MLRSVPTNKTIFEKLENLLCGSNSFGNFKAKSDWHVARNCVPTLKWGQRGQEGNFAAFDDLVNWHLFDFFNTDTVTIIGHLFI